MNESFVVVVAAVVVVVVLAKPGPQQSNNNGKKQFPSTRGVATFKAKKNPSRNEVGPAQKNFITALTRRDDVDVAMFIGLSTRRSPVTALSTFSLTR